MPTPTATRSAGAINGIVPGLTWQQFVGSFSDSPAGMGLGGGQIAGLGPVARTNTTAGGFGGEGQGWTASPGGTAASYLYEQPLEDGTTNKFYQGPNGDVYSQNDTTNSDSWWDSTGLPLVASLAFGGATAGLAAAGVGVDGVTGAALGSASAGLPGATSTGLNAAGNAAASGVNYGEMLGQAGSDQVGNSTGLFSNAGDVAGQAGTQVATQAPGSWESALQAVKDAGGNISDWYNNLSMPERLSLSAGQNLASSAIQGGGDAASTNPYSSIVQQYTGGSPSTTGYIDPFGAGAATGGTSLSGGQSIAFPSGSSSSGSGGLLGSIANLYNNGITSGSAQDYSNILGGAGSLLNGVLGYNSAQNGISAQTNAANNNNALQAAIYANQTALAKPFVDGGTAAFQQQSNLNGLNGTAAQTAAQGQFKTDPGYQFALDQGNRGVQSSAAAQGGLFSGRAAKDLTNYNQGMAAQQYGNYYNRLSGQAGIGQAAVAGQAANGNAYVNGTSSNNNAIGNAQTAGGVAGTNAITGSINSILGQNSSNQLLNLLLKNQGAGSNGYYMTGTGTP